MHERNDYDVAVVGGGLVGSSVALGLALRGQKVAVLDEGDVAFRASRGNFALVWVQSKGLGMPAYSRWTAQSARAWPTLAKALLDLTGVDVCYERPGGFHLTLSEREWTHRQGVMQRLSAQPDMPDVSFEMLEHAELARRLPGLGPTVAGGSYCPLDGHCNSLRLFRALHMAGQRHGLHYRPRHGVERIDPHAGGFKLKTSGGELQASKVVLTAGIGNARLAPMVGLSIPVRPQRGQIIVTEKAERFLHYPISTVRQTDEGGLMLGDSQEEAVDPVVGTPVLSVLADRAARMFPRIGQLNVTRTWAALRVMTQDGFPVYEQSATHPGAFGATCHSGVTLAANHVFTFAEHVAQGHLPAADFEVFSSRRFDVQKVA
jgi:glycine/D-amino acid oxidase-like deaminating enzyme